MFYKPQATHSPASVTFKVSTDSERRVMLVSSRQKVHLHNNSSTCFQAHRCFLTYSNDSKKYVVIDCEKLLLNFCVSPRFPLNVTCFPSVFQLRPKSIWMNLRLPSNLLSGTTVTTHNGQIFPQIVSVQSENKHGLRPFRYATHIVPGPA